MALSAHWQITSKLQHKALFKKLQLYALFLGNTAKVPLKGRALNYRAAVGAGTHNLVRKISKQLNRRGRFALGKLLFIALPRLLMRGVQSEVSEFHCYQPLFTHSF